MGDFSTGDIIFQIMMIGLLVLFVVSFSLFIRRMLITRTVQNRKSEDTNEKLDRIIELLEDREDRK
ncbi:hypothetical protein KP77_09370 [Jeotgalibacillus alimentarius]|uniref:DUF4083 domain-containing protein n=1 Tax=Jeotgalibacillus alimentarius TaxID=135826 RepID=A0A0C2RME7_9BACL|nr:DUF4083 domain-containing protein [Jeotgalibacillus alimentarius]KIL51425.1 hypothetical protein KP77_09370 [Jeotgalibacillus alimentarius]